MTVKRSIVATLLLRLACCLCTLKRCSRGSGFRGSNGGRGPGITHTVQSLQSRVTVLYWKSLHKLLRSNVIRLRVGFVVRVYWNTFFWVIVLYVSEYCTWNTLKSTVLNVRAWVFFFLNFKPTVLTPHSYRHVFCHCIQLLQKFDNLKIDYWLSVSFDLQLYEHSTIPQVQSSA
jgi:hypothetical protein